MKLTVGIVISAVFWISFVGAIEDLMPLDIPKAQIKKTNAKAAKKNDIQLPPIENSRSLTHADSSIEGLSDEEVEGYDEKAMRRGSITSPRQKTKTIGSENRDINVNANSGPSSSKEADMGLEANEFDTEEQEQEPDIVNNDEEEGIGGKDNNGVRDEADNIKDVDVNDGDVQVDNPETMREQDADWGKEVHEDD
ncbi:uncharacterized protein LOC116289454 [Actinia tenebrosa]|uniref:Uncharacterized protein LOC116289454 n=1 Tax=Actinia tenebrosa TaxID=6105 RepID=A0A6P8HI08_ACTTE|nr:uncharacterized protein LOC116289454 [Actinia tenebrosa]